MRKFANRTVVSCAQTRGGIGAIIGKYGGCLLNIEESVPGRAIVMFRSNHPMPRFLRVSLQYPVDDEQAARRKWRALFNDIKFKFVSIDEGIETFDQAFMAWIIGEEGKTLYDKARELRLLPPPDRAA